MHTVLVNNTCRAHVKVKLNIISKKNIKINNTISAIIRDLRQVYDNVYGSYIHYIAILYNFPIREFLNSLNKKYANGMRSGDFFFIIHFSPLKNQPHTYLLCTYSYIVRIILYSFRSPSQNIHTLDLTDNNKSSYRRIPCTSMYRLSIIKTVIIHFSHRVILSTGNRSTIVTVTRSISSEKFSKRTTRSR